MGQQLEAERMVAALHDARLCGDLTALCELFARTGEFRIEGASADKPIAIAADSAHALRPWLSMMVKVFTLSQYELMSTVIEESRVAAHWRANIYSKVTGVTVPTDLVDLLAIRDGRIVAYREFFVPR
jgi:ketosteroid isomerase-like protein